MGEEDGKYSRFFTRGIKCSSAKFAKLYEPRADLSKSLKIG